MSTDTPTPERDDLAQHFKECGCHDSWDQCPCADSGHPVDGSCGCCPRGDGLCGPRPERVTLTDEEREAIHHAGDIHHPDHCDCSAYVVEAGFQEDDCCVGLLDTFDAVERILAAREQALREEIARLSRWKEEELPVLDGLQDLGRALGLTLGERTTGPAALAAVEELQAALDRVRRLHQQDTGNLAAGDWCPGCGDREPCATKRAIRGGAR